MAKRIQLRRGTTAQSNAFTGAVGEVTVDTDKDVLVVHDGVTAGGFPVAARANADGTISLIKKDGTVVGSINATGLFNNTLTSTNTDQALTAAQGKVLQDNKLATSAAFGIGQTWQNVTGGRTLGTTYTNSTTKSITVIVSTLSDDKMQYMFVDGVQILKTGSTGVSPGDANHAGTIIVPVGSTYKVVADAGSSVESWFELR